MGRTLGLSKLAYAGAMPALIKLIDVMIRCRSELWHQSPSVYGNFSTRRPRGGRSGPPESVYPPLVSSFCPISGRLAPDLMLGPKQGGKHQAFVSESPQIVRIEPQGFWCIVGGPVEDASPAALMPASAQSQPGTPHGSQGRGLEGGGRRTVL